jgi:UDP-N-acetylmuramate dehydrogenase
MPANIFRSNASLKGLNTFGLDYPAEAIVEISDPAQLAALSADASLPRPFHILGGGSNVLLTAPVKGTVLLNRIGGIETISEDAESLTLRVGAGEVWHELVQYAISNGLGGIENLALIPGTVGAAPIQNIGAYGVEAKDVITGVQGWHWERGEMISLHGDECCFGYRDSIFKQELKGKVVITQVCFRLSKQPALHTEYGAIRDELQSMGAEPSVQSIAQAVINIRRSKLPDPAQIGNAGSFFKNPTISESDFASLRARFPLMPSYPLPDGQVKLPAGWLIEQCGWKGFREGEAGVHANQALVLVNYGRASGDEIWSLSERIVASVHAAFGIVLEREVHVW